MNPYPVGHPMYTETIDETIAAISTRPRETLALPATARPGARADFTLFRVDDSTQEVIDSLGNRLTLDRMIEPVATIIGTSHMPAARRLQ